VPLAVIREARGFLEALESQREAQRQRGGMQGELPLFSARDPAPPEARLREALARLEPDQLTPKAALEALYALKQLLKD